MQGISLVFFMIFALIIVVMYIALRRHWIRPAVGAAFGMGGSTIAMSLSFLSMPGAMPVQAIFFGALIGLLFSGAALIVGWYFQTQELREQRLSEEM
jgi:drug/metabolite transporter (DMT)-like permease